MFKNEYTRPLTGSHQPYLRFFRRFLERVSIRTLYLGKKYRVAITALCFGVVFAAFMAWVSTYQPKRIVMLPDYPHGLAMCEGQPDQPAVIIDKIAHIWSARGVTYLVNVGHMNDRKVQSLILLGQRECVKYNRNNS